MAYPLRLPTEKPVITVTHRTYSPTTVIATHSSNTVLATPAIWVIELHNGPDSRLTTAFIKLGLLPALDAVERDWRHAWRAARETKDKEGGRGALIIVGNRGQNKFFSNGMSSQLVDSTVLTRCAPPLGLDYDNAIKDPFFFPSA